MALLNGVTAPAQFLVNQAVTLTLTAYSDGTATDVGTITIGIVDADGTEVVASGTAVTDGSNGTYTYSLAAQTNPSVLYVTWTESGGSSFRHEVEVVGSILFTEVEARAFDNAAMTSTSTYPDADIVKGRKAVGEQLERYTKRSYIRRYCRAVLAGTGTSVLDLSCAEFLSSAGDDVGGPGRLRDIRKILSADDGTTI